MPDGSPSGVRLRPIAGGGQRGPLAASAVMIGALALLTTTVVTGGHVRTLAPITLACVIAVVAWRRLLVWHSLLSAVIVVILFIPIKRYELPASLPFALEPYRLLVALVALAWITSLLIDPRVRLRGTPIDKPLLLFVFAVLTSLLANGARVNSVEADVLKRLAFFVSFFLVFYMTTSLLKHPRQVDFVVKVLVWGGAFVAFFSLIESRTGYNLFNHLAGAIPGLKEGALPNIKGRGARLRVYASAQHPIALGAALVMLMPLALYLARRMGQRRYWVVTGLILLGSLSSVSRTAVVMLLVIGFVYLWLRPTETRRLWPLLLPALVLIHVALPGTLGTLKASFFPEGGLIAEQQNARVGSGRLATLGPALHRELKPHPVVGEGFGTRVAVPDEAVKIPNGPILDNQWLGVLLETGVVGTSVLAWLFIRFIRRAGREAKADDTARGWLLTSTTASVTAFAVGMFTYDAFAFIQVTFMLFFFLGLGCAALRIRTDALRAA